MHAIESPAAIASLVNLCEEAGRGILAVREMGFRIETKDDASPVTAADRAAHACLLAGLSARSSLPILSEEGREVPWSQRRRWRCYWLVDPLDGTREFVDGLDDYTVNVALLEEGAVRLGLVHAPAQGVSWAGGAGLGAWRWSGGRCTAIGVCPERPPRILASRAHLDEATRAWLANYPEARLRRCGSSVKFCRIAEGGADLYPRFGPTCEWDTAAGQGVLEGAGGAVVSLDTGQPLRYNRGESLINGAFVACADLALLGAPLGH